MEITGWIIYNGYLRGNKFLDFAEWLQKAASANGIATTIWKNNELLTYLTDQNFALLIDKEYTLPDFVIFTDKDIYLANQLELLGIRVYNCSDAIRISDDKILTYQVLAKNKLPIPKTIIAPKAFLNDEDLDRTICRKVINTFGLPLIIKEAFGSFGEQVYLIETENQLENKVNVLQGKSYVFQEFINTSYGRDIRMHVVGDEVVASMIRTATNDFRANVTAGGKMQTYTPTKQETEVAIAATKAIGADFAGVDLLFGPDDTPIICEVNSNAHIRNMYDCTGINVADHIIDYIYQLQSRVI